MDEQRLDGNVVAGALADVFVGDATVLSETCGDCGTTTVLAEVHVYVDAPGAVLRCPGCEAVVMRVVRLPGRLVVDFPALRRVELPVREG
jgi:Family of unknown function (DUF6510)